MNVKQNSKPHWTATSWKKLIKLIPNIEAVGSTLTFSATTSVRIDSTLQPIEEGGGGRIGGIKQKQRIHRWNHRVFETVSRNKHVGGWKRCRLHRYEPLWRTFWTTITWTGTSGSETRSGFPPNKWIKMLININHKSKLGQLIFSVQTRWAAEGFSFSGVLHQTKAWLWYTWSCNTGRSRRSRWQWKG